MISGANTTVEPYGYRRGSIGEDNAQRDNDPVSSSHLRMRESTGGNRRSRVGRDLILVLVGIAATVGGAVLLVDGVRGLTHVESTRTRLGLILVGLACFCLPR